MKAMQKYRVTCTNYVYEDNFDKGEVNHPNCYDTFFEVEAESPMEAIRAYYRTHSVKSFDPSKAEIEYNMIHDLALLNSTGDLADGDEIERWKKGEINLFTQMMTVLLEKVEYTDVDLEEALKNS